MAIKKGSFVKLKYFKDIEIIGKIVDVYDHDYELEIEGEKVTQHCEDYLVEFFDPIIKRMSGDRITRKNILEVMGDYYQCESDFGTLECSKKININGKDIYVDKCLADEIVDLNLKGVKTMACCCAHGHKDVQPIISINEDDEESLKLMLDLGYVKTNKTFKGEYGISFFPKSKLRKFS